MNFAEQAAVFDCAGETLVGVLTVPERPMSDVGVVVVVGGPQYRAGSHRQFVLLARALAAAGHVAMRFDYRGMGDASGGLRNFEEVNDDIAAAIGLLQRTQRNVRRVVLWGLCDGASAALLYLDQRRDPRVHGVCLLNPWVRSDAGLARTRVKHYYAKRLTQGDFWRKLLNGKVAASALAELAGNLRTASGSEPATDDGAVPSAAGYQQRMARGLKGFGGHVLLVLSGNDYTAKEFIGHADADPGWRTNLQSPRLRRIDLESADHTFSAHESRVAAEQATLAWLGQFTLAQPLPASRTA